MQSTGSQVARGLGAAPALGAALVLGVALASGIGASGATAQTVLRVANSGEPDSLDPHQVSATGRIGSSATCSWG